MPKQAKKDDKNVENVANDAKQDNEVKKKSAKKEEIKATKEFIKTEELTENKKKLIAEEPKETKKTTKKKLIAEEIKEEIKINPTKTKTETKTKAKLKTKAKSQNKNMEVAKVENKNNHIGLSQNPTPEEINNLVKASQASFNDFSQLTFDDLAYFFIKYNSEYKKDLVFNDDENIVEKDEFSLATVNSYRPSTIVNAKDIDVYRRTRKCTVSIYTQDLKPKHEDKLTLVQQTDINLQAIKYNNQNHKYTASMIIPPDMTIKNGVERLCQNTLWMLTNAFVVNIFGGSYAYHDSPFDFVSSKEPERPGRYGPVDWTYMCSLIKSSFARLLIFNHYGSEDQYKYYQSCFFRRIKLYDEEGCFIPNEDSSVQYRLVNQVVDKTQYVYRMNHLRKFMIDLVEEGIKYMQFNIKYDVETDLEDEEMFKSFCAKVNLNVIFFKNRIVAYID